MTISFTDPSLRNAVQHDQTAGVQTGLDTNDTGTPGTDTDVNFETDAAIIALHGLVVTEAASQGWTLDAAFATTVDAAKQTNAMTVTSDGDSITNIRFTDAAGGNGVLDGDDSGLDTANGDNILLFADSNSPDTIVYGIDSSDMTTIVFVIQMVITPIDGSSSTIGYNVINYAPIFHPDGTNPDEPVDLGDNLRVAASDLSNLFDFSALAATKFLFGVVGDVGGGFLVIGKDPAIDGNGNPINGNGAGDLINTSKGGGATTIGVDNQHFTGDGDISTVEQGAYFTYITGLAAGTYGNANDADGMALINNVDSARLQVSQTQAEGQTGPGMLLSTLNTGAFGGDGLTFVENIEGTGPGVGDTDVPLAVVRIFNDTLDDTPDVFNVAGMAVGASLTVGAYTVFKVDANTVRITGLTDDDWIEWETTGTHNRVLVEAVSGKWDIGAFEIDTPSTNVTSVGDQVIFDDDAHAIGPISDLNVDLDLAQTTTDSTLLNQILGTDTPPPDIRILDWSGDGDGTNGADVVINGITLSADIFNDDTLVRYWIDDGNGTFGAGDTLLFTYELKDLVGSDGVLDTAVFTVHNVPPSADPDFSLNDLPSGQNGFGILASRAVEGGPLDPDGPALVIFGRDADANADGTYSNASDTINTSKGGGPTTIGNKNQMIDPPGMDDDGEGIYFAYVVDPVDNFVSAIPGGLSQTEADDFDNIQYNGGMQETDGAFFSVVQVQGNPKTATARITTFDLEGALDDLQGTDLVLTDYLSEIAASSRPTIIEVTIERADGTTVTQAIGDGDGNGVDFLTVLDGDDLAFIGSVVVSGIGAGDTIRFKTDVDHDLALIEGVAGKFDIGDYGIDLFNPTPDLSLTFTDGIEDLDDDGQEATHTVFLDGTGIFDDGIS